MIGLRSLELTFAPSVVGAVRDFEEGGEKHEDTAKQKITTKKMSVRKIKII